MTDPSHFHLVIDTTAINIDACFDLLEAWAGAGDLPACPTPRRRADRRLHRWTPDRVP